jgi:hypothetical protein
MAAHFKNWTIGEYVSEIPLAKQPKGEWYLENRRWHGMCRVAKRKGIEVRYRHCAPYQKTTRKGALFTATGYGLAVNVNTRDCGYGVYGPQALFALYDGLKYVREMSKLIVQAYLK